MGTVFSILILAFLQTSVIPDAHTNDGRPALPDTTTIRAELAAFMELSAEARAQQRGIAAEVLQEWLPDFSVRDGEVKQGLIYALGRQMNKRGRSKIGVRALLNINVLGKATADFDDAVVSDPTNLPLRVLLGSVLVQTGRPREGIDHLEKALLVSDVIGIDDPELDPEDARVLQKYLRYTTHIQLGFGYRDLGRWQQAMQAADKALAMSQSPVAKLLKGLCLAGTERTSEAITYAVNMPPLKFRRVSGNSGGGVPHVSAFSNEWIKSQALFAIGDLAGAEHVLGEIDRRYFQRMPLRGRFWQDAGLIAEMQGDRNAGWLYAFAGAGAFMGFYYPSEDVTTNPIILGFPARGVPFFITSDGGFEGGTPFGYIAEQLNIMSERTGEYAAEQARIRALDLCDGLIARGVRADLVTAFRARVYMAAGQETFAYPDLVFAQAEFASRQVVDPGTSILLGQQELLKGNNKRAEDLFREALTAIPNNALAWRELGIALARTRQFAPARQAMDKALALDSNSMEGWYNLGILAYRQGAHDEALRSLEKAWALQPGESRVQKMLQTVASAQRLAVGVE